MTKLPKTSFTAIGISFLVMNLSYLYRQVLPVFLCLFSEIISFFDSLIMINYQYSFQEQEKIILPPACKY